MSDTTKYIDQKQNKLQVSVATQGADDAGLLYDVSCMVNEAAVILKYAHAEYVKGTKKDVEREHHVAALVLVTEHLQGFEKAYDGLKLAGNVGCVLSIADEQQDRLKPQIKILAESVNELDSASKYMVSE